MKKFLSAILASCLLVCNSHAQNVETGPADDGSWKSAFSEEGRQNWKPELTVRRTTGFFTSGIAATAGIRVDDKRTLGVWIGQGETHIDAAPGDIFAIQTAAYMRRYVHIGSRDIVALYGDLVLGCDWIYRVEGKYRIYDNPETGEHHEDEMFKDDKGDVGFYAGVHAGVRIRAVRNIHLFIGPTLTTNTIGLHFGIGF